MAKPRPDDATDIGSNLILKRAITAVPAVKYALGIAGIAAALAIIKTFLTEPRVALFGTIIMIILMVILFVFAKLAAVAKKEIRHAIIVLVWFSLLIFIATSIFLFTSVFLNWPKNLGSWVEPTPTPTPVANLSPVVLLMDSNILDVIYDKDKFRQTGEANADELTAILHDIGISPLVERTHLEWKRHDDVLRLNPDLIIMHASCFYRETNPIDSKEKLFNFFKYPGMAGTRRKFIIYGRLQEQQELVSRIATENPSLRDRIKFF